MQLVKMMSQSQQEIHTIWRKGIQIKIDNKLQISNQSVKRYQWRRQEKDLKKIQTDQKSEIKYQIQLLDKISN